MTTINFETESCPTCGIMFQVPEDFCEARESDGETFFCPNGHGIAKSDCDEDKIAELEREKAELEREKAELEREKAELQVECRRLKCRLIGQNGIVDKVRVKLFGGLCKEWRGPDPETLAKLKKSLGPILIAAAIACAIILVKYWRMQ